MKNSKKQVNIEDYNKKMEEIIVKNANKPMPDVFIAMLDYASSVKIKNAKIKKTDYN